MKKRWLVCIALLLNLSTSSVHSQECAAVNTRLSPQLRKRYIRAIEVAHPASAPKPITVDSYMGQGDWAVVFARISGAERGAYVIRRENNKYVLVDTWGGVAGPDPVDLIASWARGLSPSFPPALADCFANEVKFHW